MINKLKIELIRLFILLMIGGFIYISIEILFRGYSHWTMFIVGGLSFVTIGCINNYISWYMPIWLQMIIGSLIITLLEFTSGCIINIILNWNVWDYSNMPFNLLGQICLLFSIFWFFLSIIAILLDDYLRYILFKQNKPHYYFNPKYFNKEIYNKFFKRSV